MTNQTPNPQPLSPVLATEDPAAYQLHSRKFFDEYQPTTPTETQLTRELVDTVWRITRIPRLEAELLAQNPTPQTLAALGLYYTRLTRQFQKTADMLREIQAERLYPLRMGSIFQMNKSKPLASA